MFLSILTLQVFCAEFIKSKAYITHSTTSIKTRHFGLGSQEKRDIAFPEKNIETKSYDS